MLITSRSAAEYAAMFGLAAGDLAARSVLDCCAGGSPGDGPGRGG